MAAPEAIFGLTSKQDFAKIHRLEEPISLLLRQGGFTVREFASPDPHADIPDPLSGYALPNQQPRPKKRRWPLACLVSVGLHLALLPLALVITVTRAEDTPRWLDQPSDPPAVKNGDDRHAELAVAEGPEPSTGGGSAIASGKQLPDEGIGWDYIGSFRLRNQQGPSVIVTLYAQDSDSIAEKRQRAGLPADSYYPNYFALHAFYQPRCGLLSQKTIFRVSGYRFGGVRKHSADGIHLWLRSNTPIYGDPAEKGIDLADLAKPYTLTIRLVNGVPCMEE